MHNKVTFIGGSKDGWSKYFEEVRQGQIIKLNKYKVAESLLVSSEMMCKITIEKYDVMEYRNKEGRYFVAFYSGAAEWKLTTTYMKTQH